MQGFCLQQSIDLDTLFQYLDFVALGTSADLVSMTGENRILTYHGLKVINDNPAPGIKALLELIGKTDVNAVSDLVFFIAPRINACGRMTKATQALELLIEQNYTAAQVKAHEIEEVNIGRKKEDALTTEQAVAMIDQSKASTVLYKENWHKGVIGIAASRCIDICHRPTIILTQDENGFASGSARTIGNFDVHKALTACKEHLTQFGGHQAAAGLKLEVANVNSFSEAFDNYVKENLKPEDIDPSITIDIDIRLERINMKFLNPLNQMSPFGPDNMTPIFSTKHVQNASGTKVVGKDGTHLKVQVQQNGERRDGIAFGMAEKLSDIEHSPDFNIVYSLEINDFRGNKSPQMTVRDFK